MPGILEPIVILQSTFLAHFFHYVPANHRKMRLVPPALTFNVDDARGEKENEKKAFTPSSRADMPDTHP